MKVRYTGTSHYREIRPDDAKREEVTGFGDEVLTWEKGAHLDVPAEVAKWLTEDHADEFEVVVEEGKTAPTPGKRAADMLIPDKGASA